MVWEEIWKISEFLYENFQFFGGEIFNIFEEACFRNVKCEKYQQVWLKKAPLFRVNIQSIIKFHIQTALYKTALNLGYTKPAPNMGISLYLMGICIQFSGNQHIIYVVNLHFLWLESTPV